MTDLLSETIRILATEFTIVSNVSSLMERLPFVTQRAEQALELRERCTIEVIWTGEEYRISGGGPDDIFELSLSITFEALFARLHECAMLQMQDHIRIHAASGMVGPARDEGMFLLVGEKWAGKTTFAMHLLLQGVEIVGDELVLLNQGSAITFPRRFYLRYQALDLLPALPESTKAAPFVNADIQSKLLAIDPLELGRPWRIRPAPIRAVIFLEPNHGGASHLAACSKVDMIRRVLLQSSPPSSGRPQWMADFCATINQAETAVLHLGDLATATQAIGRFTG